MHGPQRKESGISAPGFGANGSPLLRMPLINSWCIRWSWKRGNAMSSARGGARLQGLKRRPSANYCVFQGKTSPEV